MAHSKKSGNFIKQIIEDHLDGVVRRQSQQLIEQYATRPDGTPDPALSYRIKREVHRRAAISMELDIYEPLRWTGASFLLSALVGAGIKLTTDKEFSRPALVTLLITTALTSSIQLFRILPRYQAALKGGADTACAMHEFDGGKLQFDDQKALEHHMELAGPWVGRVAGSPEASGVSQQH